MYCLCGHEHMTNRYSQEGNKNKGAAVLLHNFEGFYCLNWLSWWWASAQRIHWYFKTCDHFSGVITEATFTHTWWVRCGDVKRTWMLESKQYLGLYFPLWKPENIIVWLVCFLSEADLLYFKLNLSVKGIFRSQPLTIIFPVVPWRLNWNGFMVNYFECTISTYRSGGIRLT